MTPVRLLLDEYTPLGLLRTFHAHPGFQGAGHEALHVTQIGWSGIQNGRLLARMRQSGFDGLITTDRNLAFQQDVEGSGVFVVVLESRTNRLEDLVPVASKALVMLPAILKGQVVRVSAIPSRG
jgi:hypothetical protein